MKKIIIDGYLKNKSIFDIVRLAYPDIKVTSIYRAFDKKDIKVNGKWAKMNHKPVPGDEVTVYISDSDYLYTDAARSDIETVYEDKNIIIALKPSGMPIQPLSNQVREKNFIDAIKMNSPEAELCHRIDRNTEGLVLLAKTPCFLDEVKRLLNSNNIEKYYTALVFGKVKEKKASLEGYLFKDSRNSRVFVSDIKKKGYMYINTIYELMGYCGNNSLLKIRIITGRTHQIRAHLAHIGHPVIGDGKYGKNEINRLLGYKKQLLCASDLVFNIPKDSSLHYLNNKEFSIKPSFMDDPAFSL